MVEVFASRSGAPSLKIDGRALHSPFDPGREADRFLQRALGTGLPSLIVLLGEGLGYLSGSLRKSLPTTRIISIFYSTEVFRAAAALPGAASASFGESPSSDAWHPGSSRGLSDFLRSRVGELDVEGLQVIEWPPSAGIFPRESRMAQESLHQLVLELNGSLMTTVGSGRLWMRNSVANFLAIDSALQGLPCSPRRAVVIAAPGPSLETAAPVLQELRSCFEIWALPSSALFLRDKGLQPDLLVMTDPGFYAVSHLQFTGPLCPVAMPLSAARGLWSLGSRTPWLLAQPGLIEEALLETSGVEAPKMPPHGTVSATALDLALSATSGPVILAGLDLCMRDVASHARPNAFERLLQLEATRTAPFYSLSFRRAADQDAARIDAESRARSSRPLRTYAGWFAQGAAPGAGRLYRLLPSPVDLPGMTPLDAAALRALVTNEPPSDRGTHFSVSPNFPSREARQAAVLRILHAWLDDISAGAAKARGSEGYRALVARPSLFQLAYTIETQLLLETKRKARHGDERGARETAKRLFDGCAGFLRRLEERASHAA